jgi:hypothetical protein
MKEFKNMIQLSTNCKTFAPQKRIFIILGNIKLILYAIRVCYFGRKRTSFK